MLLPPVGAAAGTQMRIWTWLIDGLMRIEEEMDAATCACLCTKGRSGAPCPWGVGADCWVANRRRGRDEMGKQKGGLDCSGGEDEGSLGRQGGGEMQALERYELADGGRESLELGSDGQSGDGWGAMALDLGCGGPWGVDDVTDGGCVNPPALGADPVGAGASGAIPVAAAAPLKRAAPYCTCALVPCGFQGPGDGWMDGLDGLQLFVPWMLWSLDAWVAPELAARTRFAAGPMQRQRRALFVWYEAVCDAGLAQQSVQDRMVTRPRASRLSPLTGLPLAREGRGAPREEEEDRGADNVKYWTDGAVLGQEKTTTTMAGQQQQVGCY
ncbi:hypothetical protein PCL_06709 [Purpureocillium lilacinum]|uniref:Uncharacterized protein n=1 Tax=Purpureocillium lilacinum TaxID=33203 RepID=A0A2U3DTZ9_PURLI|nr:hypothetical protein PCL_06709 [Purpureocillium lilacinum]